MANPFYVKIGFSNIEIANASKVFGVNLIVQILVKINPIKSKK